MINHAQVLSCYTCGGPVVCLAITSDNGEPLVPASCMICRSDYSDVQYRMKRLIQACSKFKCLLHFFQNQPFVGSGSDGGNIDDDLTIFYNELISTMDYQLKYGYLPSVHLQKNLQTFCRILYRLGKHDQACQYGQYQLVEVQNEPQTGIQSSGQLLLPYTSDGDDKEDISSIVNKLENSTFWFHLYHDYISRYSADDKDDSGLMKISHELLTLHFGQIQKGVLRLSKLLEAMDTIEEEGEEDKIGHKSMEEIENDKNDQEEVKEISETLSAIYEDCDDEHGEIEFELTTDYNIFNGDRYSSNIFGNITTEDAIDYSSSLMTMKHFLASILHSCNALYNQYQQSFPLNNNIN